MRKNQKGNEANDGAYEVNHVEREVLGYYATRRHTYSQPHVPRRQIGARCRGTLVMSGKIDVERVHGGEHYAETNAKQRGNDVEHHGGKSSVVCHYKTTHAKHQES